MTTATIPTLADLRDDATLTHAANCRAAKLIVRPGRFGDLLLNCRTCRAFRPLERDMLRDPSMALPTPQQEAPSPRRTAPHPAAHHATQERHTGDLRAGIELAHRGECHGTNADRVIRRGTGGDDLLTCTRCRAFRVVEAWMIVGTAEVMATPPEAPEAPTRPRQPLDRWRCRVHPDEAVSWKGTGCSACQMEQSR